MGAYVLIIVAWAISSMSMQEFGDKQACEKALVAAKSLSGSIVGVCVEKSSAALAQEGK